MGLWSAILVYGLYLLFMMIMLVFYLQEDYVGSYGECSGNESLVYEKIQGCHPLVLEQVSENWVYI